MDVFWSIVAGVAGLAFVVYLVAIILDTIETKRFIAEAEAVKQAKERIETSPPPRYTPDPEILARNERECELIQWRKEVEREQAETEIEIAQRLFANESYVLTVAQKVGMHKTVDQVGAVSEWVHDVVTFSHERMGDRLTVKPLYLHFRENDTIPPKLRARRFYNALGEALGAEGWAERPSKKQGWRLSDKGREEWGFNYHV